MLEPRARQRGQYVMLSLPQELQVSKHSVELPSLMHDFADAQIESVVVGPRREVTLTVAPLVWEGNKGLRVEPVTVRFGGIVNFEEVLAFFADAPHEQSELARLGYAPDQRSKPGRLILELAFERTDARIIVQCSNVEVRSEGE